MPSPGDAVETHNLAAMRLLAGILFLLWCALGHAADSGKTMYVQFIWATDQPRPAGKKYREVGAKLGKKLSPVFRWKHYWEIEQRQIRLHREKTTQVELPKQRRLEIDFAKSGEMEIRLFRRSGLVTKTRQGTNGKMAILGGEEDSKNYFFVVVRPDQPGGGE
jgi:hypothetical protein